MCGHYCGGRYRDLTHHQSSLAGSPCGQIYLGGTQRVCGNERDGEGLTRKTTTCNVPPLFRTDTHCRNSPILPVEVVHVWYAASSNKFSRGTPHWTGTLASQYYRVHEAFHAANPPTSTLRAVIMATRGFPPSTHRCEEQHTIMTSPILTTVTHSTLPFAAPPFDFYICLCILLLRPEIIHT